MDVLVGFCNVSGKWGAWRVSKLKLKRCIENRDGKMVYVVSDEYVLSLWLLLVSKLKLLMFLITCSRKGSTFGKTCKDCELVGMTGEMRVFCSPPIHIPKHSFSLITILTMCTDVCET